MSVLVGDDQVEDATGLVDVGGQDVQYVLGDVELLVSPAVEGILGLARAASGGDRLTLRENRDLGLVGLVTRLLQGGTPDPGQAADVVLELLAELHVPDLTAQQQRPVTTHW